MMSSNYIRILTLEVNLDLYLVDSVGMFYVSLSMQDRALYF